MVSGACLVLVSLWALLLPPTFPYSAHAIVNADAVAVRAGDGGRIAYAPTTRSEILPAGGHVATITRDLAKVRRKLDEQKFTKLKLEGQLKSLDGVMAALQQKLRAAKESEAAKRVSSGKLLEQSVAAAKEKVRIYGAGLVEKTADQERVKPLFDEGIVTVAQWSETRQIRIEAEKLLIAAEGELADLEARLEAFQRGGSGLGEEEDTRLEAKIEAYEQESGRLVIQQTELRTELDELGKQIDSARNYNKADQAYELTTPIEGIVWHRRAVSGELLGDGQVAAEVADVDSLYVEAYFRRDFLNQIVIGDHASIYLVGGGRFIEGEVVDIQVQESMARGAKIINTAELDKSLLNVKIEAHGDKLKPKDIGQLAKVLVSNGHPSWVERARIWLSLLLRSHKDQ
jgi:multidrug resistance efflux pump